MSKQEYLSDGPLMVVTTDLALRHDIAAGSLGLTIPQDMRQIQLNHQQEIIDLLADSYGGNVVEVRAVEMRKKLGDMVANFREASRRVGRTPIVVSMDPAFLDQSLPDYTFQATRVSLVSPEQPTINLERNPRTHANRFIHPASDPKNGAGKTLAEQVGAVHDMVTAHDGPVALAFVEDYVDRGKSIVCHFGKLLDSPDVEPTIIAGLVAPSSDIYSNEHLHAIRSAIALPAAAHMRHMDMSDLLPTLGGRVVGRRVGRTALAMPFAIADSEYEVPVAVDAICGNYPWQADIYTGDISPACMRKLGGVCISAARDFWKTLEEIAGQGLSWRDLQALTGNLRIYAPAEDLTSSSALSASLQPSPCLSVQAIAQRGASR